MTKYVWAFVSLANAAVFFLTVGRGETNWYIAFVALLAFYISFKEWETEELLRDVRELSKRLAGGGAR